MHHHLFHSTSLSSPCRPRVLVCHGDADPFVSAGGRASRDTQIAARDALHRHNYMGVQTGVQRGMKRIHEKIIFRRIYIGSSG